MSTTESAAQPQHRRLPASAKVARISAHAAGILLLAAILAGCGSTTNNTTSTTSAAPTTTTTASTTAPTGTAPSSPLPPGVVAQVGSHAITKATLGQWMTEMIGGDFYSVAFHRIPAGLVAEPANYPACVTQLKQLTPIPSENPPQPQPTTTQLLTKCQQLYETIKTQALNYLVSAYWSKNYDTAHGYHINPAEVKTALKRVQTEQKLKPGAYQQILANSRRTPQQQQFIIENQLLNQKVISKLTHEGEQATTAFNKEAEHTENNATCRPGYTVEHCNNYQPPKTQTPNTNKTAPDQLLQEIANWRPKTITTAKEHLP
jgi:hypothetical protein